MQPLPQPVSRRQFCAATAAALGAALPVGLGPLVAQQPATRKPEHEDLAGKALVAITLDLEMSRNFPTWEQTALGLREGQPQRRHQALHRRGLPPRQARRGGVIHCFAVGRVFEQENVDWLKGIAAAGHPVGNHTYDHVNVMATKPEDIQFRFRRAPWLIAGQTAAAGHPREHPPDHRRARRRASASTPAGFRTPGGFADGLADRPDVQKMLLDLGFTWVSSKYPAHPLGKPGEPPRADVFEGIVEAQGEAQPFAYPERAGRSADEPDQRHHRLPRRPLEAGRFPRSGPPGRRVGHRAAGRCSTSWGIPPASWPRTRGSAPSISSAIWLKRPRTVRRSSIWMPSPSAPRQSLEGGNLERPTPVFVAPSCGGVRELSAGGSSVTMNGGSRVAAARASRPRRAGLWAGSLIFVRGGCLRSPFALGKPCTTLLRFANGSSNVPC